MKADVRHWRRRELPDLARIQARKGRDFPLDLAGARALVPAGVDALMVPGDARKVVPALPWALSEGLAPWRARRRFGRPGG